MIRKAKKRKEKKRKDQKLVQKTVLFAVEILCPESDNFNLTTRFG